MNPIEWKRVPADWFNRLPPEQKAAAETAQAAALTEEERQAEQDHLSNCIAGTISDGSFESGLGRVNEFLSYFPGNNKVEEAGNWILVKESPPTHYTVPPLSIWFATPWPMDGYPKRQEGRRRRGDDDRERHQIHRVRVLTPRGELGLFPHEYSKIDDITRYLEFIGDGMEIKFFGGVEGVPKDQLFYLRTRGIPKHEAIKMLLGNIRSPEVCWIEARPEVCAAFGLKWPHESRLANILPKPL